MTFKPYLMERTFGAEHEMGATLHGEGFFIAPKEQYQHDYGDQEEIDILDEIFLESAQHQYCFQPNGGKLGIDMSHIEYSTPECTSPREVALYVHGTDWLFHRKVLKLKQQNIPIQVYRDNTDWHTSFYAMHENYLIVNPVCEKDMHGFKLSLTAYLATQSIWGGAGVIDSATGEVSCSVEAIFRPESYRSYSFKEIYGNEKQENTYSRLEIRGETNGLQEITWLKFAITSLVLSMIESEFIDWDDYVPEGEGSLYATRLNALVGKATVLTLGGQRITALEAQLHFAASIELFLDYRTLTGSPVPNWAYSALERFKAVLGQIETFMKTGICQPPFLTDWLCKKHILEAWREAGLRETEHVRRALCMNYHSTNPEDSLLEGLYADGKATRLFDSKELLRTIYLPSSHPRAQARAKECQRLKGKSGVQIGWGSVIFNDHTVDLPFGI